MQTHPHGEEELWDGPGKEGGRTEPEQNNTSLFNPRLLCSQADISSTQESIRWREPAQNKLLYGLTTNISSLVIYPMQVLVLRHWHSSRSGGHNREMLMKIIHHRQGRTRDREMRTLRARLCFQVWDLLGETFSRTFVFTARVLSSQPTPGWR